MATSSKPADPHFSSPPIPDEQMSVAEFCQQYRLNNTTEQRLDEMQFLPGDHISHLTEEVWGTAGFKLLAWNRVLAVNKKYKESLHK